MFATRREGEHWQNGDFVVPDPRPRAAATILGGGLVAGVLDGLDAVIYYGVKDGVSARRIFRYIASGLFGLQWAVKAGWIAVLLGILLHFTIAIGAACVYYLVAFKVPLLIKRPILSGTIFGLGVLAFMDHVVLPLSAVPKTPHPMLSWNFLDEVFAHIFLVGLPIAWIAHRSARVKPAECTQRADSQKS